MVTYSPHTKNFYCAPPRDAACTQRRIKEKKASTQGSLQTSLGS